MTGDFEKNPHTKTSKTTARNASASRQPKKAARSAAIKRNRIIAIIAVCAAILAVIVAIVAGWVYYTFQRDNGKILQNITIAGVNVGGMTKKDAISAVSLATQHTYTEKDMTVSVLDSQITISPDISGARLDVAAAVEVAYAYGRTGSSTQQSAEMNTAMTEGYVVDIIQYLNLDTAAVQDALDVLGATYSSTLSQTSYELLGQMPSLVPGEEEENDCQILQITIGTPEYGLDMNALYKSVIDAYNTNRFYVEGECSEIVPSMLDLAAIHSETHIDPVNATMDMESFSIDNGQYGYTFDLSAAQTQLDNAQYGQVIEIPYQRIPQEITGESLSELLYRDVLATYTAAHESDVNRDVNLALACKAIDGMILFPGDEFSYNEALGERTEEKGYKPGPAYVGNDTISSIGGGICQVSSALYYCAMVADLKITERDYHGFATTYMPLGMDSTINWGTIDLKFCNTTEYPIRIEASATGGNVTVRLVGTDTKDYYVKIEYEVLNTKAYSTSYQVMSSDNAEGYQDGDVIVTPYTGYDVETYRCKYDKQTNELLSRDWEAASYYRKRDEVICKIKDAPPETEPQPTEPEATEPEGSEPGIGGTVSEDEGGDLP